MSDTTQTDKATIIVVDDDQAVRNSLVAYFEDSEFNVLSASDGREGLSLYEQHLSNHAVDLIICDLKMPNYGGLDLLRTLYEQESVIPVIVISGAGQMSDVVEALRLGASDYFIKPVMDLELLEISVRRSLERSQLLRDNRRYREQLEVANKELRGNLSTLEQDQQAGRVVQRKMLPNTPKQVGSYEFSHKVIPSLYLSGDFVEYITVGEHHCAFFIADVSGHGASSAFVTVVLKNLAASLRSSYLHHNDETLLSPAKFLSKINEEMLSLELGKHITLCVFCLDMRSNEMIYSIAGHLPLPILSSSEGAHYLPGRGRPVGLFADSEYEEYHLDLPDSFALSLFSDGILEILESSGLDAKEEELLAMLAKQGLPSTATIVEMFALENIQMAPDDIAIFTLRKEQA